ncbi:MAG: hypothetical protein AB7N61_11960 [Acidimicrobiia bacterium]
MSSTTMLAFSTYGDVIFGYVLTFVGLGVVAWRIVSRGRQVARQVPDEDKPWI